MDIIIKGKKYDLIDETNIGVLRLYKKIRKNPEDIDSIILLIRKMIKNKLTMKEIDEFGQSDITRLIEAITPESETDIKDIKKKRQN